MIDIDWSLLSRAKDFYAGLGYTYVETPWIASVEACAATFHSPRFDVDGGCLVGSGEQGLLQLAHEGKIGSGRFMTISPCFRDEPVEDQLHQRQFIKLELMDLGQYDEPDYLVEHALRCFRLLKGPIQRHFEIVQTEEGFDIMRGPIELGSYGSREAYIYGRGYCWNYGTGLALPRFSLA